MKLRPLKIALRSLLYHIKESVYQIAIISILTAIICGSLLTGYSVRSSLKRNLDEKRGKADFLISSGLRYFDASLSVRFSNKSGLSSTAIIEAEGYCSKFTTGETALDIKIYGTGDDFFTFHGLPVQNITRGTAVVNEYLAMKLHLAEGDEVILGSDDIDPLPSNAPFAPEKSQTGSKVFRITRVISSDLGGNFSLQSGQSGSAAIFVNTGDLPGNSEGRIRANRLLVNSDTLHDIKFIYGCLQDAIIPADIGLYVRISQRTGEPELISDRIFVDSAIVQEVTRLIPASVPVLTYLGNSFTVNSKSAPYSFIAALPSGLLSGIHEDEIIISRWLAADLEAGPGDTLYLSWFEPAPGKKLKENNTRLIIQSIAADDFKYSDPSLMPEFPGISGSKSCAEWDAGIRLDMKKIRKTDEDYWTQYKGTPKAFISYEAGHRLWANNFGPATAIRFGADNDPSDITGFLAGKINPAVAGFSVTDLNLRNLKASSEGVDFGMLFLGLSLFIIISCIILLSMALNLFLGSRKAEIKTYHALGFRNERITRLVFYEAFMISIGGAFIGLILGYLVNMLIINALNSVWTGAVRTDTLLPGLNLVPLLSGFTSSIIISVIIIFIRLRSSLAVLTKGTGDIYKKDAGSKIGFFLLVAASGSVSLLLLSFLFRDSSTALAFSGGTLLFLTMVLWSYRFYSGRRTGGSASLYSGLYYSYYPSRATIPVTFLAAGVFAVIITGANHQTVTEKMKMAEGGTGGFVLWAETALPVKGEPGNNAGFEDFGFDEAGHKEISIVRARKLRGDDASCLNITHVAAPSILGIDPATFIEKGLFSFASKIKLTGNGSPWSLLNETPGENIIYGIADQTVLQWGLKLKNGDTLKMVAENGSLLNIIISGGLKSSVFQGHVLIGSKAFEKYFPSVAGYSVFLVDGNKEFADQYSRLVTERLSGYGISVEPAPDRLASFFQVTNTYLDVFTVMGIFGMILGVAGLGFILIRNFNSRRKEFAVMIASGYTLRRIRMLLLKDHFYILLWGLLTGSVAAISATWPSIISGAELPWRLLITMPVLIFVTGYLVLRLSISQVGGTEIISSLRGE